ncbi:MAG: glycosyltransferase [Fidelibacterota bacterium]
MKTLKVIMAGGGTGGHLFPAITIADEIKNQILSRKSPFSNIEIIFLGTRRGVEYRAVPNAGYKLKIIWISGFKRYPSAVKMVLLNLAVPLKIAVSFFQTLFIILSFRPHIIFGTGGFASAIPVFTGALLNIPTVIQEQNSYPGLANRLLSGLVDQVHLAYESSAVYFKKKILQSVETPLERV